jgi:hypothetical protein
VLELGLNVAFGSACLTHWQSNTDWVARQVGNVGAVTHETGAGCMFHNSYSCRSPPDYQAKTAVNLPQWDSRARLRRLTPTKSY